LRHHASLLGTAAAPESSAVIRETAQDIFKQLIEIDTTDSIGSTTVAAQAMANRLLDAGFPPDHGSDRKAMLPPPLRTDVMKSLRAALTAGA
jgi:hypothetical protein